MECKLCKRTCYRCPRRCEELMCPEIFCSGCAHREIQKASMELDSLVQLFKYQEYGTTKSTDEKRCDTIYNDNLTKICASKKN